METYHATSLEDIADAFDSRAKRALAHASTAKPRARALYEEEARVWREAATIIRQTTLTIDLTKGK